MDKVSTAVRSRMMSAIKGKNTKPELLVRSVVHSLGLRFRLHGEQLPGRPDLVLPRHRTVVFVHGCFWHRHDCGLAAVPKTRTAFWESKFAANVARDSRNRSALERMGWRVVEIWECETYDDALLRCHIRSLFPAPEQIAPPQP
jgi:DNA mismatch endonuclease (patch repair protein)